MTHQRFNTVILGTFFAMVFLLTLMNLTVDPYGVFGTSTLPDGPSANERFLKIEHVTKRDKDYELLLFGSSRSGMTSPAWLEEASGLSAYNVSVFSGRPRDMETLYRAYRQARAAPLRVIVGLDAMAFLWEVDETDLSRRHHPSVSSSSFITYWMDYLLAPSFLPAIERVAERRLPSIAFNWEAGTYSLDGYDRQIAENHDAYMLKKFGGWTPRQLSSELDDREWHAFQRWMRTLEDDGVAVTVFLQPMHRQWRERMEPLMGDLRPLLNSIDGLVDLSGIGSENDADWYEQRHYRSSIARLVVKSLFDQSATPEERDVVANVPGGFYRPQVSDPASGQPSDQPHLDEIPSPSMR